MRRTIQLLICVAASSLLFGASASAITLNISNQPGSTIQFMPDGTFTFEDEDTPLNDIWVTLPGGGADLAGDIDGVFTIVPMIVLSGGTEFATISGSGSLVISDGTDLLTADIDFIDVITIMHFGVFNTSATLNLSDLQYTDSNADLQALRDDAGGQGAIQISFDAGDGQTLTSMISEAATIEGYSGFLTTGPSMPSGGGVSPMPEPSAVLCFLVGALVVGKASRRSGRQQPA